MLGRSSVLGSDAIGRTEIINAINSLGISGADVCIHSSVRSFAVPLKYGLKGIADAFLERHCTIMVPTFSDMYEAKPVEKYMPPQNGAGDYSYFMNKPYLSLKTFTPDSKELTVEEMGSFSKYVLDCEESVRGNNALNSFTALGPNAKRLVGGQTNRDVYAPMKQLYDNDGYVLLMGVGLERATMIHYAEQVAGRNPFIRWAYDEDLKTIPVSAGGCSEGFRHFEDILDIYADKVTVGNSRWKCFKARQMVDVCSRAIKNMPHITHCDEKNCERCNDAVLGGPILSEDFWTKGI